jgi:hypothetical protein
MGRPSSENANYDGNCFAADFRGKPRAGLNGRIKQKPLGNDSYNGKCLSTDFTDLADKAKALLLERHLRKTSAYPRVSA